MYMNKAFSDVLHGMMPNAIPLTCNAHILSLASDVWRTGFPDVDTLVSSFLKKKKRLNIVQVVNCDTGSQLPIKVTKHLQQCHFHRNQ